VRPIINGEVPDSTFVLTPGPGAKEMDIGMAHAPRFGRHG
jgi:hypothetical protein